MHACTFNNCTVGEDDGFEKEIAYSKSMTGACSHSVKNGLCECTGIYTQTQTHRDKDRHTHG